MASPICQVKNGSDEYVSTPNGVDVTPGATITIRLASVADVDVWQLEAVGSDETSELPVVTVDMVSKTASYVQPAGEGRTIIFRSRVNNGVDRNRRSNNAYTTTFGIYALTSEGNRVLATNEQFESDEIYGWIASLNGFIRNPVSGSFAVTGTGFVHATSGAIDAAATALARYASGKIQIDGNLQFRNTGDANRTLDLVGTATTSNKTLTLPNATDTLVARDTTDTLTNKSLTSPVVTGTPVYRVANLDIPSYVTKVATSAVTQVNCGTVAIADETTAAIDVIVRSSRDTSNTKRGVWKFSAVVSRNGGGAVLDDLTPGTTVNISGGTVTCDVSGNDFRVRITPADTDTRKWDSEIRVQVNT